MVSFECDVAEILSAKERLARNDDSDPAYYLCRIFVFCQFTHERGDFLSSVFELEARVSSIGNGLLVRYENSILVVLESFPKQIDIALRLLDGGDQSLWTSRVCSSEEGVERVFEDFRVIQDAGEDAGSTSYEIKHCDENEVTSALIRIVHEFLASDSPQTSNVDKCLSRISLDGEQFLFTCREFLDEFDIETHVCRAVDSSETAQIESLLIESDELRSVGV